MSTEISSTAIVTGGAQGIGKAITQRLLHEGWAVMIADVDEEAGREAVDALRDLGSVRFTMCDVADEAQVRAMVDETCRAFGGIDLLVNNAGIGINKPITDLSLAEWRRVIDVNLTGAFLCAKYAAPALRERAGAIVNIASTRALMSEPHTEAYAASKGGIVALTHALAMSLGPEVRVNCISPGWIEVSAWKKHSQRHMPVLSEQDHRQHPVGRVGTPEDIAAMVSFLAAGATSGFITGQNFVVDGGMTRKMIYVE